MSRRVRDLMRRDFIRVSPEEAAADVLQLMTMARVRALPVMHAGRATGIVAHRDLALAALGRDGGAEGPAGPVADFARPIEPVSPETLLPDAAARMLGDALPCLVAAEEGKGVVGLVTEGDLLRAAYRRANA